MDFELFNTYSNKSIIYINLSINVINNFYLSVECVINANLMGIV